MAPTPLGAPLSAACSAGTRNRRERRRRPARFLRGSKLAEVPKGVELYAAALRVVTKRSLPRAGTCEFIARETRGATSSFLGERAARLHLRTNPVTRDGHGARSVELQLRPRRASAPASLEDGSTSGHAIVARSTR